MGEITMILLIALIFTGPKKVSDLGAWLRERQSSPDAPRWSWSDWLLVSAALASGATALQLLFGFQR